MDQQSDFQSAAQYYRYLLEETGPEYRFWFAGADDSPEMLEFAREHGAFAEDTP